MAMSSRSHAPTPTRTEDASLIPIWSGQGVGLFRRQSAAELMAELVTGSQQLIDRLAGD
ncbi:MAG: hypothetical protein HN712_10815 [Gemmatimonadetes bacterium]|nr:hypothetical protein [Gemmatimonadota bacterium]MBT6148480.1 hypothetical protein [Gemmatimonadota bacterium]MBT7860796.1 hypothetical protein [Gemmatimonadota bacterium]